MYREITVLTKGDRSNQNITRFLDCTTKSVCAPDPLG